MRLVTIPPESAHAGALLLHLTLRRIAPNAMHTRMPYSTMPPYTARHNLPHSPELTILIHPIDAGS
jgi:hypothetical protein